jgi:hypothetical protein
MLAYGANEIAVVAKVREFSRFFFIPLVVFESADPNFIEYLLRVETEKILDKRPIESSIVGHDIIRAENGIQHMIK